jgi:hypothetical protein
MSTGFPLIFQIYRSAGIGTIKAKLSGCRGFIGPVPPPLWIRVPHGAIQLIRMDYNIKENKCNLPVESVEKQVFN